MTYSVALEGIDGRVVAVEADVHDGVPGWSLTGLPDVSVSESRSRCRSAMVNSGEKWPDRRITVAMYPTDVRKIGSHYDLAIALALLAATGSVPGASLRSSAVFGELVLDGRVRQVPGILPGVLAARETGLDRVIVPVGNLEEASLVEGISIVAVASLRECVAVLAGKSPPAEPDYAPLHQSPSSLSPSATRFESADLADVKGQAQARWCVEVAAAGGHHLFLEGPPGAGKTMLAERFTGLLPDLDLLQSIEVSKIHSVAGLLSRDAPRVLRPPYLAPHHQDTVASVVGGGTKLIKPGAVSLAHRGVLFLDEAPEFKPTVHDALRQPLESGEISVRRADGAATYPACFQLICAANPCPCGGPSFGYGHSSGQACRCSPTRKRRYQERISGPVRDRIDIVHTVMSVSQAEMKQQVGRQGTSASVAGRVCEARARQRARFDGLPWFTNSEVPGFEFRRRCPLASDAGQPIEEAVGAGRLTQRGADRVLRLAWTLADLSGFDEPRRLHVEEALHLRTDAQLGRSTELRRAAA